MNLETVMYPRSVVKDQKGVEEDCVSLRRQGFVRKDVKSFNLIFFQEKYYKIEAYGNCEDHPNPVISFANATARVEKGKGIVEGMIIVSEDVKSDFFIHMHSERCTYQGIPQCAVFSNRNLTNICSQLKNNFFIDLSKFTKPSFKCPLKQANYAFKKAVVDLNHISILPISGYVWNTSFVLYPQVGDNPEAIGCFSSIVKIMEVGKRSRGR